MALSDCVEESSPRNMEEEIRRAGDFSKSNRARVGRSRIETRRSRKSRRYGAALPYRWKMQDFKKQEKMRAGRPRSI